MWIPVDVEMACANPTRLQEVARVEAAIAGSHAAFDRVTRMLSTLLDVPIAAFTLVDDRAELVASAVGFALGRATPDDAVFCRRCVAQDDVLVVDDAGRDLRFAREPIVAAADGLRFYAGAPVRTPDGTPVGTLCAAGREPRVLDESEQQLLCDLRDGVEELIALRLAEQRLTAVNADLETFAGTAAHDLKGPLAAVAGFASLLREGAARSPQEADTFLGRIEASAARMARLVDDLLMLARADAAAEPADVPLAQLIADATAELAGGDRPAVAGALPTLHGDPVQLRQLIANLIGNARKYTAPGSTPDVVVSAVREDGGWTVRVDDRGIGVGGDADALFAPFHRAEGAAGYDGTGLGLAICRRIVERHGGRIGAAARPGGGSRFWFWLPGGVAAAA